MSERLVTIMLDGSESMYQHRKDIIAWYNNFIEEHQGEFDYCFAVVFNDSLRIIEDFTSFDKAKPITSWEYFVKSNTAIYDSIEQVLLLVEQKSKELNTTFENRLIILSDGNNNSYAVS